VSDVREPQVQEVQGTTEAQQTATPPTPPPTAPEEGAAGSEG
jgi:hypothetical protein